MLLVRSAPGDAGRSPSGREPWWSYPWRHSDISWCSAQQFTSYAGTYSRDVACLKSPLSFIILYHASLSLIGQCHAYYIVLSLLFVGVKYVLLVLSRHFWGRQCFTLAESTYHYSILLCTHKSIDDKHIYAVFRYIIWYYHWMYLGIFPGKEFAGQLDNHASVHCGWLEGGVLATMGRCGIVKVPLPALCFFCSRAVRFRDYSRLWKDHSFEGFHSLFVCCGLDDGCASLPSKHGSNWRTVLTSPSDKSPKPLATWPGHLPETLKGPRQVSISWECKSKKR